MIPSAESADWRPELRVNEDIPRSFYLPAVVQKKGKAPSMALITAGDGMMRFVQAEQRLGNPDTGVLCSVGSTPELFTKVRRPIWPLDPVLDALRRRARLRRCC